MDFIQLKSSLKEKVEPCYLLFGTDFFLVNKSIELITLAAKSDDIVRLDETASPGNIAIACNTLSMFGGRRIVIVRGIVDATIKELKSYLGNPNKDCILILVSPSEKLSVIGYQFSAINCNPIEQSMLHKLVAKQFADAGRDISVMAVSKLCNYCANNYARINNEIIKLLVCYTGEIEVKHIEELVTPHEEFQIFELGNAVLKRDLVQAAQIESKLKAAGADEYALFGNMVSTVRRLYYSLKTSGGNDIVAAVLKCSPYAVNYARRDNRHLVGRIARAYRFALDLEYKIKSGVVSVAGATTLLQMALVV